MAFALSIVKLTEALDKPGCVVCRMEHDAAIHSLTSLLWESTTDPQSRAMINRAYGFCPKHLRNFVAIELSKSGPTIGTNLIYELLAKNVSADLSAIKRTAKVNRNLRDFLAKFNIHLKYPRTDHILKPSEPCPGCETERISGENTLSTLCEVITRRDTVFLAAYEHSDGICFHHLRMALEMYLIEYPEATDYLIQDNIKRLGENREHMLEFIRKNNWKYKGEELSPEERTAWIKTMTFFSGYDGKRFDHHIDEM